ncbi:MAG TPA: hypothetical protein VIH57_13790 [Bacteroidales bacterium]
MKKQTLFSVLTIALVLFLTGVNMLAQTNYGTGYTTTQIVRNSSDVQYTVSNSDGTNATFTWTVNGGTIIVGGTPQVYPYTQAGTAAATVSIYVRWNNTNTTTANNGTLTVSKVVNGTCTSNVQTVNVESWVAPSVSITSTPPAICSGNGTSVNLAFTGKSNYLYWWKVTRLSDNTIVEDHTTSSTSSTLATSTVTIAPITNATSQTYRFEVTRMQDGFTDSDLNLTGISVDFIVNAPLPVGPINSSNSLTPR